MKETLELKEAAKSYKDLWLPDDHYDAFIAGARWQQERMYSEEEVLKLLLQFYKDKPIIVFDASEWFEQLKKK